MIRERESRPGVGTGAAEAVADGPFAHSKFTGDIDLTQISVGSSNPRYEVFLAGWAAGYECRQATIDRLEWEVDLWYFCYANKKTPAEFYTHQTDALWAEATK